MTPDPRIRSGLRMLARRPRITTSAQLWVLALLSIAWVFLSITPLPPNDLWWHMAAGRTMVSEGAWLRENRWAYTLPPDAPYVYQSWLSETVLFVVWKLGDVPLLAMTRMVAIVGAYALMSAHAWRRSGGGIATAAALLLAIMASWDNWTLRPQTLALLPGAAFVVVLDGFLSNHTPARRLYLLPVLMLLWVNLHGSFVLGLVLVGLAWLGTLIDTIHNWAKRIDAPSQQRPLRTLTLAGLASGAAAMIHPLGLDVFPYIRHMLTNAPSQQYISEWQPPVISYNLLSNDMWFFIILLLLAVLMARSPRRASTISLLWFCALSWLAFGGGRYIMWFALLLMPLLAEQIAAHAGTQQQPMRTNLLVAVLALVAVIALPWFGLNRLLGAEHSTLFATTGQHRTMLADTTPIGAATWLNEHQIAQPMLANMTYSSYTVWSNPNIKVFADQRVDMFPIEIWDEYFDLQEADERSKQLQERWNIRSMLLDVRRDKKLLTFVTQTPSWCERYRDRDSAIFEHCALR